MQLPCRYIFITWQDEICHVCWLPLLLSVCMSATRLMRHFILNEFNITKVITRIDALAIRNKLVLCLGWNVRLIVSLPRRYGVMTLRYNRRTASQPSHVVRQNLQKGKLRVLNPAIIHVFYWFNWLNLIGS